MSLYNPWNDPEPLNDCHMGPEMIPIPYGMSFGHRIITSQNFTTVYVIF